uniref:Uncharacterized protein n=1 Tax=Arundo donax TaxID=35708 RepID=A0A0A8ZNI5_ARUDO
MAGTVSLSTATSSTTGYSSLACSSTAPRWRAPLWFVLYVVVSSCYILFFTRRRKIRDNIVLIWLV